MRIDAPKDLQPLTRQSANPTAAKQSGAATQVAATAPQAHSLEPVTSIEGAVRQIEAFLKSIGRTLEFRLDAETNRTVITIRNATSGEVIRQIPNEEVLHLARILGRGVERSLDVTA